jgi:hypothetical protein
MLGDEVKMDSPSTMKVSWYEGDSAPLATTNPVRVIHIRSNVDGRLLKVMKTADNPEYLDIYVDVV